MRKIVLPEGRREKIDQDIDDEIRFHLEMKAASYVRAGLDPGQAERQSMERFGHLERIHEECREVAMNFFDTVLQDIRYALRTLAASRGFTAAALASLILGIGATTTIFSLVYGVLLRQLPFPDSDRLVAVWNSNKEYPGRYKATSKNYSEWKARNEVLEDLAAMHSYYPVTLTGTGSSEQLDAQRVTANFFRVLNVQPVLGRVFLPEEQSEAARVALISFEFWQGRFARDPNVIGKTISLDGEAHEIVGVMPPDIRLFRIPGLMTRDPSVWKPLGRFQNSQHQAGEIIWLYLLGRLKPGLSVQQAQSSFTTLSAQLESEHPAFDKDLRIFVESAQDALAGDSRTPLLVLLGAVGFVLLIANANVASLLLSRATSRAKEFAVRAAMGGKRTRLIRQLLTESIVLSLAGGLGGLLLTIAVVPALLKLAPAESVPSTANIGVDFGVLGFTIAISILSGLIFGLAPAWQTSDIELYDSFKSAARASAGLATQRMRSFIVALEIAVATVLLVGSGLLIRTFVHLVSIDPGFRAESVIAMQVSFPRFKYAKPTGMRIANTGLQQIAVSPQLSPRVEEALSRIEKIPGVEMAAVGSSMPLIIGQIGLGFDITGHSPLAGGRIPNANYNAITANYFRVMGIPLVNGRVFEPSDSENSEPVAIISRSTAERYWPRENPIGQQIRVRDFARSDRPRRIIGVVGDVKSYRIDAESQRQLYIPYSQQPPYYAHTTYHDRHFPNFVFRSRGNPQALVPMARKAFAETDPDAPITDVRTLREIVAAQSARQRFYMALLSGFAGVGLILAAVGIYGVMAYSVSHRTHEIGVRMALGAAQGDILAMVLKWGVPLGIAGMAAGLGSSLYVTRFISSWLYGVRTTDSATIATVSALLLAVIGFACYLPARRATGLDPINALRHD